MKLSDSQRYERLMAIWAMGTWLLHAQGHAAVEAKEHYGLSTAPNSRVDLSLVRPPPRGGKLTGGHAKGDSGGEYAPLFEAGFHSW